eukprot:4394944-Amphidinium_carterae.1
MQICSLGFGGSKKTVACASLGRMANIHAEGTQHTASPIRASGAQGFSCSKTSLNVLVRAGRTQPWQH